MLGKATLIGGLSFFIQTLLNLKDIFTFVDMKTITTGKKGPKPKDRTAEINEVFELVRCGYTIEMAIKKRYKQTSYFYSLLTEDQKNELKTIKMANAKTMFRGSYHDNKVFIDSDFI